MRYILMIMIFSTSALASSDGLRPLELRMLEHSLQMDKLRAEHKYRLKELTSKCEQRILIIEHKYRSTGK